MSITIIATLIISSLFIGALVGWLIAKANVKNEQNILKKEIDDRYVLKNLYEKLEKDVKEQNDKIIELTGSLSSKNQIISNLQEKIDNEKKEIELLQNKFKMEFENIANRLLKEESKTFLQINNDKMENILKPVKDQIENFRTSINKIYGEEANQRGVLKGEIQTLIKLNQQVSEDAINLTNALKGDSSVQGYWGQARLKVILDKAGLIEGVHYREQISFNDEVDEDQKRKQPDFILNLPDNKHIIIDSKVSLRNYERFFEAKNDEDRFQHLNNYLKDIENHINELSRKNYEKLYQITTPDFVLMFMPIEPALALVFTKNPEICDKALGKNIILLTGSTLLATLSTISYIWRQEVLKKNILRIGNEVGSLYDKFVLFVENLKKIGKSIDDAKTSYQNAMNKLTDGKGNLVSKIEKIKELGVKVKKAMPQEMVDGMEKEEEGIINT